MLRFTIRDLLWLMVVVGMGAGWWVSSREKDRYYLDEMLKASERSGRHLESIRRSIRSIETNSASHPTTTAPPTLN
jgi:hypothetical protein